MLSYSILKHLRNETKHLIRCKHAPDHWSVVRKKAHPIDKALAHFDDFYKQVFSQDWVNIRQGLLGKQKYVAIVNNYGDSDETKAKFELNGAVNIRTLFNLEKNYLQEELVKTKRGKALEKIFQLEKQLDNDVNTDGDSDKKEETFSAKKFSLDTSMKTAQIDEMRTIDSKNILSSEILHQFIPATKIKGKEDFIPESDHYKLYDESSNFSVSVEREYDIHFPEHLNVYCFMSNNLDFEPSIKSSTGVLNYYLMDGGSILPILALDIKPGNTILDLCAAPGGKSLLAIQTLYPARVVSNDVSHSRVNRIKNVYKQFLFDFEDRWLKTNKVAVSNHDGRFVPGEYDRILVDVPCTTDRHSLQENDNNIFKSSRIKERLKLPELQCELLVNALKLINIGGVVVYSTCSLSPIQNDGVVHMALKKIWEETKIKIVVKDLTPALLQTRSVYKIANRKLLKYGHLVLPDPSNNFGPTYFCKLKRIK